MNIVEREISEFPRNVAQYQVDRSFSTVVSSPVRHVRDQQREEDRMSIFVKTITGRTHTLVLYKTDTIEIVKQEIQENAGVKIEHQRLVCSGRMLDDGRTLSECNVENGSTIHIILRFPACRDTQFFVKVNETFWRFPIPTKCGSTVAEEVVKIARRFGRENTQYSYIVYFSLRNEGERYKRFRMFDLWGDGDLNGWGCDGSKIYVIFH